jgi:hypothetical protein
MAATVVGTSVTVISVVEGTTETGVAAGAGDAVARNGIWPPMRVT